MLEALLEVVLPVFIVAGTGFVYAGLRGLPVAGFTDVIIYLTGACLVFHSLATADPLPLEAARVPVTASLALLGGMALAFVAHRTLPWLRKFELGAVLLPVSFMNAGNLGLPLLSLAFGQVGFRLGMLYFVTFATFMYSVGVGVMAGRKGIGEVLKMPLLYGTLLGLGFNQMQWPLPSFVEVPVALLGQTVIPLMLLSLGGRLRSLVNLGFRDLPWLPIFTVVLLRMAGGAGVAWGANWLLGNDASVARVALLVGMLPPAIMNFALVEKFGQDPEASSMVSGTIALGTASAVVVLPIVIPWL